MKLNYKTGLGKTSWNMAAVAGYLGGLLTVLIYAGVPMTGPLNLIALAGGGLGVIAIVLLTIASLTK